MGVLKPIEKAKFVQDKIDQLESEILDKKAKIEKLSALRNKWHLTIDEFSIV